MIRRLAIFGATGDLTIRYLLPALIRLVELGRLPEGFSITALAREPFESEGFRRRLGERLRELEPDLPMQATRTILQEIDYRQADVTDAAALSAALRPVDAPLLAYLALPPSVFEPTIRALGELHLPQGTRVVIEKPFGWDLASAQLLNRTLSAFFAEEQIFRIDHFLGMQTVQNILGLRFANRIVESLWNATHIERVEIVWDETLTLEGRAGYYDETGALLDMIQNHLLQLLCLIGMEAPLSLEGRDLRDRKSDVLRAVRRHTPQEVERWSVRGRYSTGRIGEREVPAYQREPGVDPGRGTETYARVTLFIDNWRWAGVPFVLRSGKALGSERREIAVHFRPVPHLAFEENAAVPNLLRLQLEPEWIALTLNINGPGDRLFLRPTVLDTRLTEPLLLAYSRLLLDALQGDGTLAIRGDEAEEAWRIIEPVTRAWQEGRSPLREYPAGSAGPERE